MSTAWGLPDYYLSFVVPEQKSPKTIQETTNSNYMAHTSSHTICKRCEKSEDKGDCFECKYYQQHVMPAMIDSIEDTPSSFVCSNCEESNVLGFLRMEGEPLLCYQCGFFYKEHKVHRPIQTKREDEQQQISQSLSTNEKNSSSSEVNDRDSGTGDKWDHFYYRDHDTGETRGPYVQKQMQEWYTTGALPTCTEVSINEGDFTTIDELIRLYGIFSPFYVEEKITPENSRGYYVRHLPTLTECGPFSREQMQFCYEQDALSMKKTLIRLHNTGYINLDWFVREIKNKDYPFGNHITSPFNDLRKELITYFYRRADRPVKGPFSRKQMHTLYDCNVFKKVKTVEIAIGSPDDFVPLATFIRQNGCRYPLGHELTEKDFLDIGPRFYYLDQTNIVVEGPFVRSQMQFCYERQATNKNTKISIDHKRFMTIGDLIERNGVERPFYGDCQYKLQQALAMNIYDEFYYRDESMEIAAGPFVAKQLQYWLHAGLFQPQDFHFSTNQHGPFKSLRELIKSYGLKMPFTIEDNTDNYNYIDLKEYYFRDTRTSDTKGPFVAQQMQKWFEDGRFCNEAMRFSVDGIHFSKLAQLLNKIVNKYPFSGSDKERENSPVDKLYFYREYGLGDIRGPFVEAQIRTWYKRGILADNMEISIDGGHRFHALYQLVAINGAVNPFSKAIEDTEDVHVDIFYYGYTDTGKYVGPYVADQMQMWYLRGWFDKDTNISKNGEEFRPLSTILSENGNIFPFRTYKKSSAEANTCAHEDVTHSEGCSEDNVKRFNVAALEELVYSEASTSSVDETSTYGQQGNVSSEDNVGVVVEENLINLKFPEDGRAKTTVFMELEQLSSDVNSAISSASVEDVISVALERKVEVSEVEEEVVSDSSVERLDMTNVSQEEKPIPPTFAEDTNKVHNTIEKESNGKFEYDDMMALCQIQEKVVQSEYAERNDGANALVVQEVINCVSSRDSNTVADASLDDDNDKDELVMDNDNLAFENDHVVKQISPKPTTINWLAVTMVTLLLLLSNGLFVVMAVFSHNSKDRDVVESFNHCSRMVTFVNFIIAILVTFAPSDAWRAFLTK